MQGRRDVLPLGLMPLGLRVLDGFRSLCCMKEFGDAFDGELLPRLLTSWRKLQLSPFTHCPLVSHYQQSPKFLCTRCFVPWFLTTAVFSKLPFLAPKFLFRMSCSILLFTITFNLWQSGYNLFFCNYMSYNSNTVLNFSDSRILNLFNPSKMSSCGIFVTDNKIPSHFESNSSISSFRKLIVNRSV